MLSRETAHGVILSLSILCLGLVAAIIYLWQRPSGEFEALDQALRDPAVRSEVIGELVEQSDGFFDAFPDPLVARILQPNLERVVRKRTLTSNEYGMPERSYAMPKESGTIRVVLLGDSYVFGSGVKMEDRLGVHLERFLSERAPDARIEVLHLGIPSWNILAECAYLNRQLEAMQPDLVVQIIVPNDLDDISGVRGFGTQADYTPMRLGGRIYRTYPRRLGFAARNPLLYGLDTRSTALYAQARDSMRDLAENVQKVGGRYLLVPYWLGTQAVALERFGEAFAPEQMAPLPRELFQDLTYRVGKADGHWNAAGHERVAKFLYGVIEERDLLPRLALPAWPEASEIAVAMAEAVQREVEEDPASELAEEILSKATSVIDFRALTEQAASQVYGGINSGGVVGPYASLVLPKGDGSQVVIEGEAFTSPAMGDRLVHVKVESGGPAFAPVPGQPFRWEVSLDDARHELVTITFRSQNYVYGGADLRELMTFILHRIAIE